MKPGLPIAQRYGQVPGQARRWLMITNNGRRYVEAEVRAAKPLVVDQRLLRLQPGARATLTVDAHTRYLPVGQPLRSGVTLLIDGRPALEVPASMEPAPAVDKVWLTAVAIGGLTLVLIFVLLAIL